MALLRESNRLYVTCGPLDPSWCEVDVNTGVLLRLVPLKHNAVAPVVSADGRMLWVCLRFRDEVASYDLATGREIHRIRVSREPLSAVLTTDGRRLLVVNHLPNGPATVYPVASAVTVIDAQGGSRIKDIVLPNGSTLAREVAVSPDGRYAAVTHVLSRFYVPTTQADRGWIIGNAVSVLDLTSLELVNTVLLDSIDRGAANPWAVAWSSDGRSLCVTHAGTHEMSVLDAPALATKLTQLPPKSPAAPARSDDFRAQWRGAVPDDLAFLVGLRQRVSLHGNGPRALAASGSRIFVAGYFSDSLEVIELGGRPLKSILIKPGSDREWTIEQRGERWFNDASLAFQGWQSCASCHSDDARVDGMNWDLLNDGIGNPKNSKSLLWSHRTPPAMSMGVRDSAETAVRAGLRSILFGVHPEPVPAAMDAWLKSLKPGLSPHLVNGKLSPSARRGEAVFNQRKIGCARCHPAGLFTDFKHHDVGTQGLYDQPKDAFDTPTLVELWRTRPYLHDGSAGSLREVLVQHNPLDRHGQTSRLSAGQIDDLIEYLLSL
jgi:hypothetical protein